jgi:hypothetical protein
MPGLAGQSPNYRGVKIVTGRTEFPKVAEPGPMTTGSGRPTTAPRGGRDRSLNLAAEQTLATIFGHRQVGMPALHEHEVKCPNSRGTILLRNCAAVRAVRLTSDAPATPRQAA